jgi:hypothetical protein
VSKKTLRQSLARYMDPEAFKESVPDAMKFTCKNVARVRHDKLKVRRDIADKRAGAAIRFFLMPENRARLEAVVAPVEAAAQDPLWSMV